MNTRCIVVRFGFSTYDYIGSVDNANRFAVHFILFTVRDGEPYRLYLAHSCCTTVRQRAVQGAYPIRHSIGFRTVAGGGTTTIAYVIGKLTSHHDCTPKLKTEFQNVGG